ncbi:MAG: glycosyltransferase, partial [Mucilaginibacter polytrichastri]|nr:glycosyltransferase [Mucilaginibacter polytrichastri]
MRKRLAIITTHPIQYYAPVFRLLHERGNIEIKVFYTWGKASVTKHDPGFGQTISWDIPLTEGYPLHWERNVARDPGSHHFNGIDNPDLIAGIRTFHPDAVLVIGWSYRSHLQVMRTFKGKIPVFFRGDSILLDTAPFPKNLLRSLSLRWIYRHIDHAFFVGELNRRYFKKYGVKEAQLSFASHAIDNARFAEDRSAEARAIREKLNIGDADFMILFAGKLEPKKDPFTLLDAFRKLNRPDVHLVFAGSGELEEALKGAVSDQQ